MLHELTQQDRLQLVRFACAMAWSDLEVPEAERSFVHRLAGALGLTGDALLEVESYLNSPPDPEDVDPQDVPEAHRDLLLIAAKAAAATDGKLTPREAETLRLLEQLLTGNDSTEEWGLPPQETEELDQ
jgi:tellurite resistance protein